MEPIHLSAVIITKNEALNISECLESLSFADELVILDAASSDNTREIARHYGARIEVSTHWSGFGPEKNKAMQLCQGEWILSIDADERISRALRDEILQAVSNPGHHIAFAIPRISWFCGKFIRHSGWRPDHVIRLFKRGYGHFSDHLVHESLICNGPVGELKNDIIHMSFRDFESVIHKMNLYSTASAQQLTDAGKSANPLTAVVKGFWAFTKTYFLRFGFLDGYQGLLLAISNAQGAYYRYIKLWFNAYRKNKNI